MIFSGFREDQGMSRKCEGPCCIAHPSYLAFDAFSTSWISWGCKSQVPLLVVSCLRLGGWTMDQAGPPEGPHWSIMAFRVHPCPSHPTKNIPACAHPWPASPQAMVPWRAWDRRRKGLAGAWHTIVDGFCGYINPKIVEIC